jgi:D-beta-D-heptose 7-phosphate kinase/D-beta-D-heptose 1-phosphate adenosyltransferase
MKKVLVIGDVMLDTWQFVQFAKVSPEDATVKVYKHSETVNTLGGAANVAKQLKALSDYEELGWEIDVFGVIGCEPNGYMLAQMLKEAGITWRGVIAHNHPTTVKVRLFEGPNQILRVDDESTTLPKDAIRDVCANLNNLFILNHYDAIVVSDYAKGVIFKEVMNMVKMQNTPIFVDPKLVNIDLYHDVHLLKLNKHDLECLWDARPIFIPDIKVVNNPFMHPTISMYLKYNPKRIVVTLGEAGSVTYGDDYTLPNEDGKDFHYYRSEPVKHPFVCGAGDVYLSILVYCYLQNMDDDYACMFATETATEVCKSISTNIPTTRKDYMTN